MTTYEGWHFSTGKLGYNDGREIKVGETLTVEGPLAICGWGLHASALALDALKYAPSRWVERVTLSDEVLIGTGEHADKACGTARTTHARFDASDVLREFIRDTLIVRQPHLVTLFERAELAEHAENIRALDMASAPLAEIKAVMSAAQAAAQAVVRPAALDAARPAARPAARDAARDAAWAAAWDAARPAAWDAAWADLNARLEARLLAAMEAL